MRVLTLVVSLLAITSRGAADTVFVSEVVTKASTGPTGPAESYTVVTIKVKGEKYRIDTQVKGVVGNPIDQSTIVDRSNGTLIKLQHSRKTYDRVTPEELEKQVGFTRDMLKKQGAWPVNRPVLKPTGKTGTMRGYSVAEYTCTTKRGNGTWNMTYWLADSLAKFVPTLAVAADPLGAVMSAQFPDPASFVGIPVQMTIEQLYPPALQVVTTINLLSLEERPLPDSDFAVPEGYAEGESFGAGVRH